MPEHAGRTRAGVAILIVSLVPDLVSTESRAVTPWAARLAGRYEVLPDTPYRHNPTLKLDLYLPRNRDRPVACAIFFHGGGWAAGTKESEGMSIAPYLDLGWAVANVEYRLAGVAVAPAAVEDGRCALRWVSRHARENGLDPDRIVVTGLSAGGHLALMTGMLPVSAGFDEQCLGDGPEREPAPRVAAIVNWFGVTDVAELLGGRHARRYAVDWMGSSPHPGARARVVSPLHYVRPGLPPVLTLHGDADDVVPYSQALRLHQALDQAGVANQLVTIAGGRHGLAGDQALGVPAAFEAFLRQHGLLDPARPER